MSHRTRIAIVTLALLASLAAVISPAGAATAGGDHRPCATFHEFLYEIQVGMTEAQVSTILDGPGLRAHSAPRVDETRRFYGVCGKPFHKAHLSVIYSRTEHMTTALWMQHVHVEQVARHAPA